VQPISLKIKGVFSYQEEQTIDFKPLISKGLFGIFGDTGSGKSAILECITLALFGRTRFSTQEQVLNSQSQEAKIEFIFYNSLDNGEYLFEVIGKRKNDKKIERKGFKKIEGAWKRLKSDSAEKIIKLNYENFKRAVIIPQNQFMEFIDIKAKDRRAILVDLFELENYKFEDNLKRIIGENKIEDAEIGVLLEKISYVNPELIEQEKKNKILLEKELTELDLTIQSMQTSLNEQEELKTKSEHLEKITSRLQELTSHKARYSGADKELQEYEKCFMQFNLILNNLETFTKNKREKEEKILSTRNEYASVTKHLSQLEEIFDKIQKDYDATFLLENKITDLKKISEIQEYYQKLQESKELGKVKNIEVGQIEETISNYENNINILKQKLQQLKANKPDTTTLAGVLMWYSEFDNLNENIEKEKEKYNEKNTELTSKESAIEVKCEQVKSKSLVQIIEANIGGVKINDHIKGSLEILESRYQEIEIELAKQEVYNELQGYASKLTEGEPCALCGSLHHPNPLVAGGLQDNLDKIKKKKNELLSDKEFFKKSHEDLKLLHKETTGISAELNKIQIQIASYEDKITEQKKKYLFGFSGSKQEAELELKKSDDIKFEIEKVEADLTDLSEKIKSEQRSKDKAKEELNYNLIQQNADEASINAALKALQILDYKNFSNYSKAELDKTIKKNEAEIQQAKLLYKQSNTELDLCKTKLANLNGELTILQQDEELLERGIDELRREIEGKIKSFNPEKGHKYTLAEVQTILKKEINILIRRQEIDEYFSNLNMCEAEESRLKKDLFKSYDKQEHEQLASNLQVKQGQKDETNKQLGGVISKLIELQKNLDEKIILTQKYDKIKVRGANLNTLEKLFTGKETFIDYIISEYMRQLCHAANERFHKMTNQQFQLDYDLTKGFMVIDNMSNGDQRLIESLSGGEKFMASLSLALALSDSIQAKNGAKQKFLFLDEGFGTLDQGAINNVFRVLKSLHKEDLIIGLISHIEGVKQEVDTCITVEKDSCSVSRITA